MKEEEMYKIIAWALRDMLGDEPTDIEESDSDEDDK